MKILLVIVILYVSCYSHAYPTYESGDLYMRKDEINRENIKKLLDELNISVPSDLGDLLPRVRSKNDIEIEMK